MICEAVVLFLCVCVCTCVVGGMLVNPMLSLGTDLAHITARYYSVRNLLCIETVIIYCRSSSQLSH